LRKLPVVEAIFPAPFSTVPNMGQDFFPTA